MESVYCPICKAGFTIQLKDKKVDDHDISVRMRRHIEHHSIVQIMMYIDDIWASEYYRIIKEQEK